VAGNPALQTDFASIREQVLQMPRDHSQLALEIIEMRERIYNTKRPAEGDLKDLKHSRGCMVDIEFMVQYWVLAGANNIGSDCLYSDNISLLKELYRLNQISGSQSRLVEIYQDYQRLLHESVLQNQSAEIDADLIVDQVQHVVNCWNQCFSLQEN
jgi:glutamate-ammonia-ligase adenylyltransferase